MFKELLIASCHRFTTAWRDGSWLQSDRKYFVRKLLKFSAIIPEDY